MKEDKAYIIRKTLIVVTLILIFATLGLLLMSFQIKTINLNYYGQTNEIKTVSSTVQSFLLENNIYVTDDIEILPGLDTQITNGLEIKISSKTEQAKLNIDTMFEGYKPTIAKIIETTETISYSEEKRDNSTINRGVTNVLQDGKEGQKVIRYLVKYNGEQEIYKAELDQKVVEQVQNKIIEVGTLIPTNVSRSAEVNIPSEIIVDEGFKQYSINLPVEQQKYAYNMCKKYGVQYELLLAVMYKESGYNPNAIGGGNSYGLCQIHVSNHARLRKTLGISNFLNPYDNITAGAYMLSMYFGSARKVSSDITVVEKYALNSYNMGEGAYYSSCYSRGIVDRSYSTSVRNIRDRLIANGGL